MSNGRIVSQGTVSDALTKDQRLAKEFKHDEEATELDTHKDIEGKDHADHVATLSKQGIGKLIAAEELVAGHVSWKACKRRPPKVGMLY